ncbi:MAG: hypothetical protein ETSY1_29585 [Candidatus Entotheonella factor]|uniref:R body protein n=1 Tax=Entotheonella factor TaxID=1429438 RepID=W4LCM2_ENTF1|nr:MAG: hypothetical protein ETSY1_29585 [Candidatus Entotheonella factor]
MADPTALNGLITDAVTQANVKVMAEAPAQALANVYQVAGQVNGMDMQNAVSAQQQMNSIAQAVTTQGANAVLTVDTAAIGRATLELMTGNSVAVQLAQLLASVASGQEGVKAAYGAPPTTSPQARTTAAQGPGPAVDPVSGAGAVTAAMLEGTG